jgi:hypothetical protein
MTVTMAQVSQFSPIYYFHDNEAFFPCTIEYLLTNATLHAADGSVLASNPSQVDLSANRTDGGAGRYVDIDPGQYGGQPLQAGQVVSPLYYAVQTFSDAIVIHYLSLHAYQGGQTCRALRSGTEFDCIVKTFGIHQGDLERVAVILSNDGNFTPLAVEYESHGDRHVYAPALVPVRADATGWHPIVQVALNGHSLHNLQRESNPVIDDEVSGIVAITAAMSDLGTGISWNPVAVNDFRLLGLDDQGHPIGNQSWAMFAGRLGKHQDNSLDSATYFNGSGLSFWDWAFVKAVGFVGALLDKFPEDIKSGDGPEGPGARGWVRPAGAEPYLGSAIAVLNTSNLGQGGGAIAFLSGRFYDAEKDSILQFWNNDNSAAVISYGLDGSGVLATLATNNDLGQGPGAIGWLSGAFLGAQVEQAIQLWANGGALGMILYGIGETEGVHALWSSENMGQGPGAVAWLTGDFAGTGQDAVLQCWSNGGQLGMILYRADATGAMTNPWSNSDMGEGAGAVAFLAGKFCGNGKTQVLQCWNNGGPLGMIVYGDDGTGGLRGLWSSSNVGQGYGATQWLVGDFLGSGSDQVLQCWGNGSALGMILYAADATGAMSNPWSNSDMGEGPGAVQWLVGDFTGDGKDQVLQCWGNGSALGMILYGADGSGGLRVLWSSPDMGEGPGANAWFAGNFTGGTRDRIIQLWGNDEASIQYGTLAQD